MHLTWFKRLHTTIYGPPSPANFGDARRAPLRRPPAPLPAGPHFCYDQYDPPCATKDPFTGLPAGPTASSSRLPWAAPLSLLGAITGPTLVASDHYTNYVNVAGRLPEDWQAMLHTLKEALKRDVASFRPFFIGTK